MFKEMVAKKKKKRVKKAPEPVRTMPPDHMYTVTKDFLDSEYCKNQKRYLMDQAHVAITSFMLDKITGDELKATLKTLEAIYVRPQKELEEYEAQIARNAADKPQREPRT